jgi:phosphate starvation-inducible protein PhoH and related proteins
LTAWALLVYSAIDAQYTRTRQRVVYPGLSRNIPKELFTLWSRDFTSRMKTSVRINRGIESLFGTKDENIRLLENNLHITTRLKEDSLELDGEAADVERARKILNEYVGLVEDGHIFQNGDLNSYLRVVTSDQSISLRALIESGRQRTFGKKVVTPKTINQRIYLDAIEKHDLAFGIGPAGTGKTYLAVAMGVNALLSKQVSRIILTRPAVEAGEKLGFLPGTLQEKIDPYLRPLYDALFEMLDADKVEKFLERNVIEVAPIAFMRGRTLNDSFIILDEAQNSTPEQMKMVLTRQGFNSKMVITGDITQIDLPAGRGSGLIDAMEVLRGIEEISFVMFDERDVVRHTLVQKIIRAYDRHQEANGLNRQMALRWSEPPVLSTAPAAEPSPVGSEAPATH